MRISLTSALLVKIPTQPQPLELKFITKISPPPKKLPSVNFFFFTFFFFYFFTFFSTKKVTSSFENIPKGEFENLLNFINTKGIKVEVDVEEISQPSKGETGGRPTRKNITKPLSSSSANDDLNKMATGDSEEDSSFEKQSESDDELEYKEDPENENLDGDGNGENKRKNTSSSSSSSSSNKKPKSDQN